jgi:hypothetical protein
MQLPYLSRVQEETGAVKYLSREQVQKEIAAVTVLYMRESGPGRDICSYSTLHERIRSRKRYLQSQYLSRENQVQEEINAVTILEQGAGRDRCS